jgi:hypothetical protein
VECDVRASRRMRTATVRDPHASRRIAAHLGCGSACARRPAMLLSMRATVCGAFWPNEARRKNQPAAVGNDRRFGFAVSGLLFTMNGATPTCRAVSARGYRPMAGVGSRGAGSPAQPTTISRWRVFRQRNQRQDNGYEWPRGPTRKIRISFSGEPACSGDKKIPRRVCPAGGRQLNLLREHQGTMSRWTRMRRP